ncbi:MAG TPA: ATP-binding protein [Candidatus Obscuribacterales bacterium]
MADNSPFGRVKLTLRHKGLLLLAVPLLLQLAFLGIMAGLLVQAEGEIARDDRRRETVVRAAKVNDAIYAATIALDIYSVSSNALAKSQYDEAMNEISSRLSSLSTLAADEYPQAVAKIRENTDRGLEALRQAKTATDNKTLDVGQYRIRQLFKEVRGLTRNNQEILAELSPDVPSPGGKISPSAESARRAIASLLVIGIAINVLLSAGLAYFFIKGITRRLAVISDNTYKVAAGQPLNTPIEGDDEIAHLDRTFHAMHSAIVAAAKREHAIIENTADVICSINSEGKLTSVSESSMRLWGFPPQELLGRHFIGLVETESRDATLEQIEKAMKTRTDLIFENQIIRKDGTAVAMAWSVRWVDAEKSLFCVVRDISEQKKLERMKEEFVAMVSHDLRTPLTSLLLFLPMLTEGVIEGLPPKVVKWARQATDEVSRLVQLVNSLLDIAKLESGHIKLTIAPTSLGRVIERSMAAVGEFAASQDVRIKDVTSNAVVLGDEERLVQVMVNLLSNAVQYSPHGGSVAIRVVAENGYVAVKVSDQGPGIAKEDQHRIFDRFEQGNLAEARVKGSAGLGLAICKAIVDEHKGAIGVESEPGQGSTFWFKLPLEHREDGHADA